MPTYLTQPKNKLTLGATVLTCELSTAKVIRQENGFDQATIELKNTSLYPGTVTADTDIKLEVTNEGDAYPTNPLFKGKVRFPIIDLAADKKTLTLSCLGSGYGFGDMVIVNEYGSDSVNPTLDTICEIATNINDNFINKVLGGVASGHSYTTDFTTTNLTAPISFMPFPYKPVLNSLNDLVDLVSALNAGSAGPHWIVTTDDVFHIKQIGINQTDWTKYYGGSTNAGGQATLTYGVDYHHINSEILKAEKNYIIYYGMWRRPSNGDIWTENNASQWDYVPGTSVITFTDDATIHIIGGKSLKLACAAGSGAYAFYPSTKDAHWDFSGFTDLNTPNLNFYYYAGITGQKVVSLCTGDPSTTDKYNFDFSSLITAANTWCHISIPVGPYYKSVNGPSWVSAGGTPDWSDINSISFMSAISAHTDYIDGLHFGDAPICRVAWNSDLPGGVAKMQLIVDNVGKDDTLKSGNVGSTDQGLMAQYAYAELLRKQKDTQNLIVDTPMLPEALPGQFFDIQSTDFRTTKITHAIDNQSYRSFFTLTDDVTNGLSRVRYEDQNKIWAAVRPEWQDRQASSMKAGTVDWRIAQLIENYAP
jgi:hypothetical protein